MLALRNTRRHTRRTLLTGLAICIAVAAVTFMSAYMKGAVEGFLETFIRLEAGHVKVLPTEAEDRTRPLPLQVSVADAEKLTREIEKIPAVAVAAPRIRFPVLLDKPGGSIPAFGTGVVFRSEKELLDLESILIQGRIPGDGSQEVVMGDQLAKEIGLAVGDELFMVASDAYGGLGPGLYTVSGLFHSGVSPVDRKNFYIPLNAAQEQLSLDDACTEIAIRIRGDSDDAFIVAEQVNQVLRELNRDDIIALPWQRQGWLYRMMAPMKYVNVIVMFLLGIIAMTTIVNTVLMSVIERTREIGALRALGYGRATVMRLILSESLAIGIVGTALGLAVGMTVALILQQTGIDFSTAMKTVDLPIRPVIYPHPDILIAVKAALFGMFISLAAAWYPARVAVRLEPATALRTV